MDDREDAAGTRGLFRAYFGGEDGSVATTFRNLATADVVRRTDERLGLSYARFDLPPEEGCGAWHFLSPAEGIFAVLTDCEYHTIRHERVVAEGLIEFHFLLEGPVELSLPQELDATAPTNVSLIACQQAPGMAYDVVCQPGTYKMASFYVRPELIRESFGMDLSQGMARQLLSPREGTMAMTEQKIDPEFLRLLRGLFEIRFSGPRDLTLAAARILELLVLSVDAVDRGGKAEEQSIVFTARELAMFDRAREVLAGDFTESQTIPRLARKLGTNATKLKSGFRLLYGTTIFAFRNRHRMHRAMQLLAEGDTPIAAVAHAVGFRHQASFTSAFRAHFGLTPTQARQRLVPTDAP
ncbi:helix-turn-helix transcriptional regulator [Chelatococcus asaccharovorans]|uniref:helix-turn-helix transcriptional regulator n=1 Tax=Chelatococcus asaccharovorans TaxID=28210 RepID=UPI00224C78C7|nr:AraC family transcriptional regulator [Chelatococcus asaccharovorans]CAH1657587.1 AraC family transcriptional regulator [Chelatococcus asaccharovorans]CAH1687603.1 AraC family transcriptional regulator [Chelatococcus asaccharovorans]